MFKFICIILTIVVTSTSAINFRVMDHALGFGAEIPPLCPTCADCEQPTECTYGFIKNFCDETVCAKGPSESCGGLFDVNGHCGLGLTCRCNICTGCSMETLDCYYKHCEEFIGHNERAFRGISRSFLI